MWKRKENCVSLNLVFIQKGLWILIIQNVSELVLEKELEFNPSHPLKQEGLKLHLVFQIPALYSKSNM